MLTWIYVKFKIFCKTCREVCEKADLQRSV